MKTKVTPAIIAASVLLVLIVVAGIYKLTLGSSPQTAAVSAPKSPAQQQQAYTSTYAQDKSATPQAPSQQYNMTYGHGMGR